MRLFTAIDIPSRIADRFCALMDRLRPLAELSWSPPEHLHVTTKFIGEWPHEVSDGLNQALASVPPTGPFEIAVRGLGWFPKDRNPRVFWAGIEAGPELRTLARDTEQALAALGVPVEDREFHPHLTLARRRNPVPLDRLQRAQRVRRAPLNQARNGSRRTPFCASSLREIAELPSDDFGCFRAESFFLYLSKGGRYTKLSEFPLVSKL